MVYISFDHFMAGCFGGTIGVLLCHPLDTIKAMQQTSSNKKIGKIMYDIIIQSNGLKGFYRGLLFPLLTTGFLNSIIFGIYGNQLKHFQSSCRADLREQLLSDHIFLAGCIAGFCRSLLSCPIEVIKITRQTRNCNSNGSWSCLNNIIKTRGFFSLYRGITPMLCRDVFPYGIYMLVYDKIFLTINSFETIKVRRKNNYLNKDNNSEQNKFEMKIISITSALAGSLAAIIVVPFDVIKTIMQSNTSSNRKTMIGCIIYSVKENGWRRIYRGSYIWLFRSVIINTSTFIGYEYFLDKR